MQVLGRALLTAVFVVGAVLPASCAPAKVDLHYKFKEGDKLAYEVALSVDSRVKLEDKELIKKKTTTMNMTWEITDIDKDGKAKLTQTIDRIRLIDVEFGEIARYDTQDSNDPDTAKHAATWRAMKSMVGGQFILAITPQGERSDIQLSKNLLAALKGAGPAETNLSPEGLKDMVGREGLVLPKGSLNKGDTWSTKVEMELQGGHKWVGEIRHTYMGETTIRNKKLHSVELEPLLTFEANPNAKKPVSIKQRLSMGTAYFDNDQGRLVEWTIKDFIELDSIIEGNNFRTRVRQSVSMKLLPNSE